MNKTIYVIMNKSLWSPSDKEWVVDKVFTDKDKFEKEYKALIKKYSKSQVCFHEVKLSDETEYKMSNNDEKISDICINVKQALRDATIIPHMFSSGWCVGSCFNMTSRVGAEGKSITLGIKSDYTGHELHTSRWNEMRKGEEVKQKIIKEITDMIKKEAEDLKVVIPIIVEKELKRLGVIGEIAIKIKLEGKDLVTF